MRHVPPIMLTWTLVSAIAHASPASPPVQIAASGRTVITSTLSRTKLTAVIDAVTVPGHSVHVCSGGRTVCSPVEHLALTVGTAKVDVPDSVIATLSDVNTARFEASGPSRHVLVLTCGDASAATTVRLLFDARRVLERDVISNEAGMLAERTRYNDLSSAFR